MVGNDGFDPIRSVDGYLPIEDHGLIGDGSTAGLVARDGSLVWLCVPRFDDEPIFASILDRRRGGCFRLAPAGTRAGRQRYEDDTGILHTDLQSSTGTVRITDCLALRHGADLLDDMPAGRGVLVRSAVVLEGEVDLDFDVEVRGDAESHRRADGICIRARRRPGLDIQLVCSKPVDGHRGSFRLRQGERVDFSLRWIGGAYRHQHSTQALLEHTRDGWRRWAGELSYAGPRASLVRRSAVTLKLLDNIETGAILAAPTSSLPERIGGVRNWDYRFAWIRDAAFSVYALQQVGMQAEANGFLGWMLDAIEHDDPPRVLHTIDGTSPPDEREDPDLEGYRRSAPVRWGNAAAYQTQHDSYGELLDCAYQWVDSNGSIEGLWPKLSSLVDEAAQRWSEPDHGIWEVRSSGRVFTHSAAMCHVALDRGVRLAERLGLSGERDRWRTEADRITKTIVEDAWSDAESSLVQHIGEPESGLDSSLLTLPLRRVLDAKHPRMTATTAAIARRLGAGNGLLYRYDPDESPDGLSGHEGAFLLCSFWMVDNLALQGRIDEAGQLYESLCDQAGPLGLLPEQINPTTGEFLGNYPQAFSHVGVITSGANLARLSSRRAR